MTRKRKKETPETPGTPRTVTPMDIQQKEFRLAFRGYNERDVDEFLDELTQSVAALVEENRRLRGEGGLAGIAGGDDVRRQADEVLRQAREEADRILAEARGAGAAGPVDVEGIPSFLARERDFLQGMAAMIQGHAETIREMAREARARQRAGAETAASVPEPAPAGAPPPALQESPAGMAQAPPEGVFGEGAETAVAAADADAEPEPVEAVAEPEPPDTEALEAEEVAEPEPVETVAEPEPVEAEAPAEPGAIEEGIEPAEETVRLPEAEPAEETPVSVEPPAGGQAPKEPGQRSLRELFWGEED